MIARPADQKCEFQLNFAERWGQVGSTNKTVSMSIKAYVVTNKNNDF